MGTTVLSAAWSHLQKAKNVGLGIKNRDARHETCHLNLCNSLISPGPKWIFFGIQAARNAPNKRDKRGVLYLLLTTVEAGNLNREHSATKAAAVPRASCHNDRVELLRDDPSR
jgi:hypothetical protein